MFNVTTGCYELLVLEALSAITLWVSPPITIQTHWGSGS